MHEYTTATKRPKILQGLNNSCLLKHPLTCTSCMLSSHVRSEGKIWPQTTQELAGQEWTVPCWNIHCLTCTCMLSRHVRSEATKYALPTSNRELIPALLALYSQYQGLISGIQQSLWERFLMRVDWTFILICSFLLIKSLVLFPGKLSRSGFNIQWICFLLHWLQFCNMCSEMFRFLGRFILSIFSNLSLTNISLPILLKCSGVH